MRDAIQKQNVHLERALTHMSKSAIYFANDQLHQLFLDAEQVEMNSGDAWENCFDNSLCTQQRNMLLAEEERKFSVNFLRV
jgi:hypothetical protein